MNHVNPIMILAAAAAVALAQGARAQTLEERLNAIGKENRSLREQVDALPDGRRFMHFDERILRP